MLKRLFLCCAATALIAGQAAAASFNDLPSFQAATNSLTLIDFDTDTLGNPTPGSGPIGVTYASLGVVFPLGNDFEGGFTSPVSAPNGWISNTFVGSEVVFTANFTTPVTAVGVHNVLFGGLPGGSELRAYDALNNLLGSVLSDNDGNTKDFFGLTTSAAIDHIEIGVNTPSGWGLDNLYFGQAGPAAVPEPATLTLAGFGLAGLCGYGWKRRKQARPA